MFVKIYVCVTCSTPSLELSFPRDLSLRKYRHPIPGTNLSQNCFLLCKIVSLFCFEVRTFPPSWHPSITSNEGLRRPGRPWQRLDCVRVTEEIISFLNVGRKSVFPPRLRGQVQKVSSKISDGNAIFVVASDGKDIDEEGLTEIKFL